MSDKKIALIATLPKSGTWYAHIFFWCYEQLLMRAGDYSPDQFQADLIQALDNHKITEVSAHQTTLNIDRLFICHSLCPGFNQDELYDLWGSLNYPASSYNGGEELIRYYNEWDLLDPQHNPNVRIVYLYRNPLDHFVSYYKHIQYHIDDHQRYKLQPDGTSVLIKDLHDFVFESDKLSAFIKHYYSFKNMQIRYPQQIMLMSYENLTTDPYQGFYNMLSFLGATPDTQMKLRLFKEVLAFSAKDSLGAIESTLNKSLVGDQVGNEKHIRGGEVGKWQRYFTPAEVVKIESILNRFNISLQEFQLTNDKNFTLSWLADIEDNQKQDYQAEFFENQLLLSKSKLTLAKKTIKNKQIEIQVLQDKLEKQQASLSWRITLPLREIKLWLKNIKAKYARKIREFQ